MKGAGKTFNCPWLFIYPLFKKRTVPLGENSCKGNYFVDGKQSMGNFDTPDLHRFSWLGKSYMYKKATIQSLSDK